MLSCVQIFYLLGSDDEREIWLYYFVVFFPQQPGEVNACPFIFFHCLEVGAGWGCYYNSSLGFILILILVFGGSENQGKEKELQF